MSSHFCSRPSWTLLHWLGQEGCFQSWEQENGIALNPCSVVEDQGKVLFFHCFSCWQLWRSPRKLTTTVIFSDSTIMSIPLFLNRSYPKKRKLRLQNSIFLVCISSSVRQIFHLHRVDHVDWFVCLKQQIAMVDLYQVHWLGRSVPNEMDIGIAVLYHDGFCFIPLPPMSAKWHP